MKLPALIASLLLASSGCAALTCELTNNATQSCRKAAAANAPAPSSEPAAEEAPAESSSSSSEESKPSEGRLEPAHKDCLASGTKTNNYHLCCADAAKGQIEPVEGMFTCV